MQIFSGIDVVDINRYEFNDFLFSSRYMTKNEYLKLNSYSTILAKKMYMASIWALKEAIIKATCKKIVFSAIDINFDFHQPIITNVNNISCSISFEDNKAFALAIYYKE